MQNKTERDLHNILKCEGDVGYQKLRTSEVINLYKKQFLLGMSE